MIQRVGFLAAVLGLLVSSHGTVSAQSTAAYRAGSAAIAPHIARGQQGYYRNVNRTRAFRGVTSNRFSLAGRGSIGLGTVGLGSFYPNPYFSGYGIVPGTYNRFGYYSYQNQIPLFSIYPPTYYRSSEFGTPPKSASAKVTKRPYSGPKVIENPFYNPKPAKKRNRVKNRSKKQSDKKQKAKKANQKADRNDVPKGAKAKISVQKGLKKLRSEKSGSVILQNPHFHSAKKKKQRKNNLL